MRQRRRDDVSGNAEHRTAATITCERLEEKLALAAEQIAGELRLLHRRDAAQHRRIASRRSARRASRFSSAPARAICSSTSRRPWNGFSPKRRCRSLPTARTKRRSDEQGRIAPASDVADHSRIRDEHAAVIATKRRSTWRFGIGIGFTCCTYRPGQRSAIALRSATVNYRTAIPPHRRAAGTRLSAAAPSSCLDSPTDLPYITAEACPHHLLFNIDDYAPTRHAGCK